MNRPLASPFVLLSVLAGVFCASTVTAGNVLRVGAGQPFATIGAAVLASGPGDLVVVDPGTYPGFVVDGKDVAIVAAVAGGFTVRITGSQPAVDVRNVARGATVGIEGCFVQQSSGAVSAWRITNCAGTVTFRDSGIDLANDLANASLRAAVEIVGSASVSLYGVDVQSATPRTAWTSATVPSPRGPDGSVAAVRCEDSGLWLRDTTLQGYDEPAAGQAGGWGGDALRVFGASSVRANAIVGVSECRLVGGRGTVFGGSCVHWLGTPPAGDVLGCGPLALVLGRGPQGGGGFLSFNHDRGIVQSGSIRFDRFVPACLRESYGVTEASSRVSIGTTLPITVSSLFGRAFALAAAPLRYRGVRLSFVENAPLLDFGSPATSILAVGTLPSGAPRVTTNLNVPNSPAIVGAQLGLQSALGPPTGASVPTLSMTHAQQLVIVP